MPDDEILEDETLENEPPEDEPSEGGSVTPSIVDINKIATDLNGKADIDLTNCVNRLSDMAIEYLKSLLGIKETITINQVYVNGTSGYIIYSNGLIEQWGINTNNTPTIALMKPYKNTNYNIQASNTAAGNHYENGGIDNKTVNGFRFNWGYTGCYWRTIGY